MRGLRVFQGKTVIFHLSLRIRALRLGLDEGDGLLALRNGVTPWSPSHAGGGHTARIKSAKDRCVETRAAGRRARAGFQPEGSNRTDPDAGVDPGAERR